MPMQVQCSQMASKPQGCDNVGKKVFTWGILLTEQIVFQQFTDGV